MRWFNEIEFAHPEYFWFLIVVPLYVAWYVWKHKTLSATMQMSSLGALKGLRQSWRTYLRHVPVALRMLAIVAVVAAIARPQSASSIRDEKREGINIVLAFDISSSMLAVDMSPNRIEVAKEVAKEFIASRPDDNIGLVVFAGESFTQCPLTSDHNVLVDMLTSVKTGMVEDGTAIGLGLATAVARIKDSQSKDKVVVLLTDGDNNRGSISPLQAAEIAKTFGVRVYTIGVGSLKGVTQVPVKTAFGVQMQDMEVDINDDLLTQMAEMTGGKYFRATDKARFRQIYEEIDAMEKTVLEVREYTKRTEEYLPLALAATLLLLLELLLRGTLLRTLP